MWGELGYAPVEPYIDGCEERLSDFLEVAFEFVLRGTEDSPELPAVPPRCSDPNLAQVGGTAHAVLEHGHGCSYKGAKLHLGRRSQRGLVRGDRRVNIFNGELR